MKNALLTLLAREPAHGYELKQLYEQLFKTVLPPVNAGQIYTTLARLERDQLVQDHHVEQNDRPDKRVYMLTPQGREAVRAWFAEPVNGPHLRDEFFLKLMLARATAVTDIDNLLHRQRQAYLQALRHLNDLLAPLPDQDTRLLIQGAILHLKADLQWLDLCEESFGEEAFG
jgi:DNA-binding PadR family transcriptional regulator